MVLSQIFHGPVIYTPANPTYKKYMYTSRQIWEFVDAR